MFSNQAAAYLLFLRELAEVGYAKTAFGLRDWAREQYGAEFERLLDRYLWAT